MPRRIFCIGALHFDVKIPCDVDWLADAADNQKYANLDLGLGGTGFNLANILMQKGVSPHLFAVVGNDELSQCCVSLARNALAGQVTPLVTNCSTRAVALIYAQNGEAIYRRVVGPEWSSVDAISTSALMDVISSLQREDILFLDGYILRKRIEKLEELAELIRSKGIRCALELVPHDIWKFRKLDNVRPVLGACSHISCNVATIEALMQVSPLAGQAFRERVEAMRGILTPVSNANWHLRGGKDGSEFSALVGPEGVQYRRHCDGTGLARSLGDAQFIDEVLAAAAERRS